METQALLDRLTTSLEVGPEFLEVLVPYLPGLLSIGVDLSLPQLQCEFRKR